MQDLTISIKLRPATLEAVCDTFPRDERMWPNVMGQAREKRALMSVLIPLSRKLIKTSLNHSTKPNHLKKYKVNMAYHEASVLEQWLAQQYATMSLGYDRHACATVNFALNELLA